MSRGHLNSYVLPLKRRRSLVFRPAIYRDRAEHSTGFASTRQPYAAAVEVAGRQSARYPRAGEAAAAPTHFAAGECRLAAWGPSESGMVSHGVYEHWRPDLAGSPATACAGHAA